MNKLSKLIITILPLACLFVFHSAFAASSITLSPDTKTVGLNQEFSVSLLIDSDVKINAAQGVVSFSPSVLKMTSVDNSASIFNFWVEDPTISGDVGTMSFTGGNPKSVSGTGLKILTMKFKAVGIGTSAIKFSNGVVTADDGMGTNVLATVNETSITVSGTVVSGTAVTPVEQPQLVERAPSVASGLPSAPKLSVSLYPDQKQWYSQIGDTVIFWDLPKDIIGVAVSVDKNPNGIPTTFEKQLYNGKDIGALKEGVNYVHVRFKNNIGVGQVSTYKISLDTTAPLDFKVQMPEGLKTDNPSPSITFDTNDSLSGIAFYSVIIDSGTPIKNTVGNLTLPLLEPGKHSILVKAFDNAGNNAEASLDFEILPIASPEINFVTQPFYSDSDNVLLVRGSGIANSITLLSVVKSDGTIAASGSVRADESGQWEYNFSQTFQNGKYTVIARSQDDRGALSLAVKSNITVKSKPIFKIGAFELDLFGVVIILALFIIGSFAGGYYFYKVRSEKIGRKIFITKQDIGKIGDMIKEDLEKLKKAIKTEGTFDDEFVIAELEKNIAKIDKYIQKEVESIGK